DVDCNVACSHGHSAFNRSLDKSHTRDQRECHRIAVPMPMVVGKLDDPAAKTAEYLIHGMVDRALDLLERLVVLNRNAHGAGLLVLRFPVVLNAGMIVWNPTFILGIVEPVRYVNKDGGFETDHFVAVSYAGRNQE